MKKVLNQISDDSEFQQTSIFRELTEKPLGFIDIGARDEICEMLIPLAKNVAVLGFEPDKSECERIMQQEKKNGYWHSLMLESCALSNRMAASCMYKMAVPTNDSLRNTNVDVVNRYNMEKFRKIGTEEVQTNTLDQVLRDLAGQGIKNYGEFIKLDTQGTEYEILQGAKNTLDDITLGVICEVSFFEVYQKQKLFSDVDILLRNRGFSFYGFTDLMLRSGKRISKLTGKGRERYLYADAVFFKDPYAGNSHVKELSREQKIRLMVISLLLEYYDFCIELAEDVWKSQELECVITYIKKLSFLDPMDTALEVKNLLLNVEDQLGRTNLEVGNFIKSKYGYFDCDDWVDN